VLVLVLVPSGAQWWNMSMWCIVFVGGDDGWDGGDGWPFGLGVYTRKCVDGSRVLMARGWVIGSSSYKRCRRDGWMDGSRGSLVRVDAFF